MTKGRPPIDKELRALKTRLAEINAGLLACYETIEMGQRKKADVEAKIAAHVTPAPRGSEER